MKYGKVIPVLIALTSVGCSYPHKVFRENTGMEISKEVNLCPGAGVKDAEECIPVGSGWEKANTVEGVTLKSGDQIFQSIDNNFLFQRLESGSRTLVHRADLWNMDINNPREKITTSEKSAQRFESTDYILEPWVRVEISELYQKKAIEKAVATLTAEASSQGISLSADFVATFKSNISNELTEVRNTRFTYHYISAQYLGNLSRGEDDSVLDSIADLEPAMAAYSKGNTLITGVSGFVFGRLKQGQSIVEHSIMENAINASIGILDREEREAIEQVKGSASIHWSSSINEEIETEIEVEKSGIYFYPLWIRVTSKK